MAHLSTIMSCLLFTLYVAAGEPPGKAPEAPNRPGVIGVSVEFPEKKIAPEDRTPQGELKAIRGATAVIKTERPIQYRSVVLPAGTYPVTVAAGEEGGRNLFFVIGPAAGGSAGTPAPDEKKSVKGIPGQIRALFHLSASKKPAEAVEFAVGVAAKANRFTLTIRAGGSQGKASLRLAD